MPFTINGISEKSIVDTCTMFNLRVDFLTAYLPRVPSQVVLSLYFGLVMSSTMSRSFLSRTSGWKVHPVVVCEAVFWVLSQWSIVRRDSTQILDFNKEDSVNIVLLVKFRSTRMQHNPKSRIIVFVLWLNGCRRFCCKSTWSVSQWKWFSIFTNSWTRRCSASFTTSCDSTDTLKSISCFFFWFTNTDLPYLFDLLQQGCVNKQRFVDFYPHMGLPVHVVCDVIHVTLD